MLSGGVILSWGLGFRGFGFRTLRFLLHEKNPKSLIKVGYWGNKCFPGGTNVVLCPLQSFDAAGVRGFGA